MKKIIIASVVAVIGLSACDNKSGSGLLSFDPPTLPNCDVASVVTVKWDVRNKHPEVHVVSIYVTDEKTESLFAEGGAAGEAKTGKWARPGIQKFLLKDKATGKVLDDVAISGPACK